MKCNVSLELNLQQWPSSCLLPKDPERFYWNIAIFHQKEGYAFYPPNSFLETWLLLQSDLETCACDLLRLLLEIYSF